MKTLDWYSLYGEGWQNEIIGEAFSHPAKFSRALIRRIYEHALGRGWLAEGDAVLDPFAGVALGAADALALGLNWIGNELEAHFVDMGRGCECTGISKEDWRRCFGRWKRFAHRDGRHWCPRCLAEAERVIEAQPLALPGLGPPPTASYERNSGKIPHTEPHHYTGNLGLFAKHSRNGARATLLQGDSRELLDVLEGARARIIVASPPYIQSMNSPQKCGIDWEKAGRPDQTKPNPRRFSSNVDGSMAYGINPRNLGNMREGDFAAAAVVSSPPFAGGCAHTGGADPKPEHIEGGELRFVEYGQSAGQLAALKEGDVDAVISSPPFVDAGTHQMSNEPDKRELKLSKRRRTGPGGRIGISQTTGYGQSPGQLAAMPEGAFEAQAVVSSPPYEGSMSSGQSGIDWTKTFDSHRRNRADEPFFDKLAGGGAEMRYSDTADNLGNTQGDTFWSAARQIVRQCWLALAPGGYAIWVLKAFVRNKAIVDFPDQWRRMCEACGFETVEWIRAWLVEDRGAQWALDGELVKKRVERKSFFRRLAERKGSPRIDYEVVLVMRKPQQMGMEGI